MAWSGKFLGVAFLKNEQTKKKRYLNLFEGRQIAVGL